MRKFLDYDGLKTLWDRITKYYTAGEGLTRDREGKFSIELAVPANGSERAKIGGIKVNPRLVNAPEGSRATYDLPVSLEDNGFAIATAPEFDGDNAGFFTKAYYDELISLAAGKLQVKVVDDLPTPEEGISTNTIYLKENSEKYLLLPTKDFYADLQWEGIKPEVYVNYTPFTLEKGDRITVTHSANYAHELTIKLLKANGDVAASETSLKREGTLSTSTVAEITATDSLSAYIYVATTAGNFGKSAMELFEISIARNDNAKVEYIYVNNHWEKIGFTTSSSSNVEAITTDEINNL